MSANTLNIVARHLTAPAIDIIFEMEMTGDFRSRDLLHTSALFTLTDRKLQHYASIKLYDQDESFKNLRCMTCDKVHLGMTFIQKQFSL